MVVVFFCYIYCASRVDIQFVDVDTTEIVKADRHTFKREEMARAVIDAAAKITKDLSLPSLPREIQAQREERAERMNRTQAVSYYTKGLLYQDRGDTDKAKELFSKALAEFPDYTEAQEALRQVGG